MLPGLNGALCVGLDICLSLNAAIGRNIRHRRWMLGIARTRLAEKLNLSAEQVQRLEDGLGQISAELVARIAAEMNEPAQSFCNGICRYCS